ncbi:MAG: hypothetical protein QNJ51_13900 [Calothrix sp. MO_167.B12]|nr:hypothetical protein [Calothrix sp. MO_167.B12]
MSEPTLASVYGASAAQDALTVTLTKADYSNLTASADNTAESIFVATFLNAAAVLTPAAQTTDPDIQVTIDKTSQADLTRNGSNYIRHSYTVNLDVPNLASTVNPDSF